MSSIEEDIKRCEQLTRPEHASWIGLSNQNAIKTLLCNLEALCDMQRSADRELQRQKQINEEHQKINGELRERVKELENENREMKSLFEIQASIAKELEFSEKDKMIKFRGNFYIPINMAVNAEIGKEKRIELSYVDVSRLLKKQNC